MINSPSTKRLKIDSSGSSNQLRVLFVLGVLWGGNGITSHLKTLSLGLMKQGIEVAIASDVASVSNDAYDQAMSAIEDFKRDKIPYFIVPFPNGLERKLRILPETLKSLEAIIQEFNPNIIHLHSLSVIPYIHLLRLRYKIPFISTCHMEPSLSKSRVNVIRVANRLIPNLLGDRFIAISSELQEIFEKLLNVPSRNIERIYHGVDSSYFRRPSMEERLLAKQSFGLKESDQVICLIGRLSTTKGHDILIRSLEKLKSEGIMPIALFAGKGYLDEEKCIRDCAIEHNVIDSIKFLDMTDSRQVLWASDILVLPSRKGTEAFPLVIIEAMLCGVIPMRTPASGAGDQIDNGINGYIFPFEDNTSLACHIQSILENSDMREKISHSTFVKAQKYFSQGEMTRKTIRLFREILEQSTT